MSWASIWATFSQNNPVTLFLTKGKRRKLSRETWPVRPMRSNIKLDKPAAGPGLMSHASGRVVLAAIAINGTNFFCKVR
jgi:hypothetical protein